MDHMCHEPVRHWRGPTGIREALTISLMQIREVGGQICNVHCNLNIVSVHVARCALFLSLIEELGQKTAVGCISK